MRNKRVAVSAAFLACALVTVARFAASEPVESAVAEWPYYGGDAGGGRYSRLGEINRSNVARLKIAWEYHTGDVSDGSDGRRKSAFETTPVVADGMMYLTTPFNRVVALDPENRERKVELRSKDRSARALLGRLNQPRRGAVERCAKKQ
jgi:quinoprotein glucose dehydrogenase